MLEFTGERVVPGLVDPNLLNEHLARYRFASLFSDGAVVLDAGCGSGYGTAELANSARTIAMDLAAAAVDHARHTFSRPGVEFLQGACEVLPFRNGSFDLVLAFEVIEHLERWPDLLAEARRVLRPSGVLLVSTPNKSWYEESRGIAGPNPWHVREFEAAEFLAALNGVFPHVRLWTQNHSEAIAFLPACPSAGILDSPRDAQVDHAEFFFAACSQSPILETRSYAWLPAAGNILRQRARHVSLLQTELHQKDAWLQQSQEDAAGLMRHVSALQAEIEAKNSWAAGMNEEVNQGRTTITGLQAEAAERMEWIADLESQISRGRDQIESMERTIVQRTAWARGLDAEVANLRDEVDRLLSEVDARERKLRAIAGSKWIRLGNKLHLGPVVG